MKTFSLIVSLLAINTHINAQEAKIHLRDFTPNYTIGTFVLQGDPSFLKRRVIAFQRTDGIKSAYWDEDSQILTFQYDRRSIGLSQIKDWFNGKKLLSTKGINIRKRIDVSPVCCTPFINTHKKNK